jgi:hypothetical protein
VLLPDAHSTYQRWPGIFRSKQRVWSHRSVRCAGYEDVSKSLPPGADVSCVIPSCKPIVKVGHNPACDICITVLFQIIIPNGCSAAGRARTMSLAYDVSGLIRAIINLTDHGFGRILSS